MNAYLSSRRVLRVALGAAMVAASVLAAFAIARFGAGQLVSSRAERLLAEEQSVATRLARGTVHTVNQDLMLIRGIPQMIAQIREVQDGAAHLDIHRLAGLPPKAARARLLADPALAPLNELLHASQNYFGADLVWLATPDGLVIASSDAHTDTDTLVGASYGDREYFKTATLGSPGQQYLIGRKTRQPGIFFSAPVYAGGRLVGVAVVKLGLRRLSHWVDTGASFVTDANGVIVLANDAAITGMAVPGARVFKMTAAQRRSDYQQEDFAVLPIEDYDPTPGTPFFMRSNSRHETRLVRLHGGGQPYMLDASPSMDGELTVYTINEVPTLRSLGIERQRYTVLLFGLLISSAGVLMLLIRHLRRERRQLTHTLAMNAALEHEVKYDALTGSLSRSHFLKRLRAAIVQARDTGMPAAIVLIDLDHFKHINDTWGHALGDTVLVEFVRLCHDSLREDGVCGRLGGEEFAIILSGATEAHAFDAAERLRETVRATRIDAGERTIGFTISAGIAGWHAGDDESAWLQRADAALYLAKSHGRDRSVRESDLQALTRRDVDD